MTDVMTHGVKLTETAVGKVKALKEPNPKLQASYNNIACT